MVQTDDSDPSPAPGSSALQTNNYSLLLKNQLIRKHLQQQEKQRQMEQMNGGQMAECQQGAPFQGGGHPLPPDCGSYPMGGPPQPNPAMLSHAPPLPHNRMALPPGNPSHIGVGAVGRPMGVYMGGPPGPKQPLYHPSQEYGGMPLRQVQGMMGMAGPPRQGLVQQGVARPGMPMPGPMMVPSGGSVSGPGAPMPPHQHLRQALHPHGPHGGGGRRWRPTPPDDVPPAARSPSPAALAPAGRSVAFPPAGGAGGAAARALRRTHGPLGQSPARVSRRGRGYQRGLWRRRRSRQPAVFPAGFAVWGARRGEFAPPHQPPSLPSSQGMGVASLPNRVMQKLGGGAPGQGLTSMAHQGLQQGYRPRGPLSALAGMKPVPPGMVHHPAHGMAPPSYPNAGPAKHSHPHPHPHPHSHGPGYGPGNPGQKLPQYEYTQAGQSNGALGGRPGGGGGGEVDFIDTLVGSNEDWLNNLTMIDEYLEQNS
ncbi:LOW QUALITY PROTEIN: basic proline-rich protein [Osmerus eperlanus]|uniref:LOW QUALITY PROTEIN: basic proline-rich protein n=1 Tax=Osmerus eperlanus TaxID=29151 RepID=UPI002E159A4F